MSIMCKILVCILFLLKIASVSKLLNCFECSNCDAVFFRKKINTTCNGAICYTTLFERKYINGTLSSSLIRGCSSLKRDQLIREFNYHDDMLTRNSLGMDTSPYEEKRIGFTICEENLCNQHDEPEIIRRSTSLCHKSVMFLLIIFIMNQICYYF